MLRRNRHPDLGPRDVKFVIFSYDDSYRALALTPGMGYIEEELQNPFVRRIKIYNEPTSDRPHGYVIGFTRYDQIISTCNSMEEMMDKLNNLNGMSEIMLDRPVLAGYCDYHYMSDDEGYEDVCGEDSFVIDVSGSYRCEKHWTF